MTVGIGTVVIVPIVNVTAVIVTVITVIVVKVTVVIVTVVIVIVIVMVVKVIVVIVMVVTVKVRRLRSNKKLNTHIWVFIIQGDRTTGEKNDCRSLFFGSQRFFLGLISRRKWVSFGSLFKNS